ncbi:hypothetical protein FWP29_22130 [Vibrio parahaemolyticus]|nr:hypothetical protein [Vibrio parahaemolyticus]EGQ9503816.1 hypothetical protein [Vibrio parahaemolyticus]EGQ9813696.1 hypothetical protein [Vibrio parahaemolyticus]EGR0041362.1 hypothetical protein [Vibrio parahaemolyticus]EGR1501637.1 hypothetical protein [Vibrio parahaemolyticus]
MIILTKPVYTGSNGRIFSLIIPNFSCTKNNLKCDFYHQNRIFYSIESPSD